MNLSASRETRTGSVFGDLSVIQDDHAIREGKQGEGIRGDITLAFAEAKDYGTPDSGGYDSVRLSTVQGDQSRGAFDSA